MKNTPPSLRTIRRVLDLTITQEQHLQLIWEMDGPHGSSSTLTLVQHTDAAGNPTQTILQHWHHQETTLVYQQTK